MLLAIGSDHRGYDLKGKIAAYLTANGHTVQDMGCYSLDSADYPDFASAVARSIASGKAERGVLICGSGIGMSIAANKFDGIRAALCCGAEMAMRSRLHNDANILCLGSDFIERDEALRSVGLFVTTAFEGGRHQQRLDKIAKIESI